MPTLIDFFCGAGGMGIGFKQAGFRIIQALDIDKYAVESYRVNVGEHVRQMDIAQIPGPAKTYADVWSFGFPCQDLSVAGKQAGLFEGKRSGLFFEIMRLLQTTKEQLPQNMPKVIMAENVKGLKPYLSTLEEEYAKVGYRTYYTLFNSKYWGVPQSRERYFVVGIREDLPQTFQFPEQQTAFIPKLSSVLENEVADKYYIADEKAQKIIEQALKRLESLGSIHPVLTPDRLEKRQNGRRAKEEEEPMFTITAQDLHGVIIDNKQVDKGRLYVDSAPTLLSNDYKEPKQVIEMVNQEIAVAAEELQTVYLDKDGAAYCCDANYFKGTSPGDVGNARRTQIIEPQISHVKVLTASYNRNDGIKKEIDIAGTVTASDWRGLNRNQDQNIVAEFIPSFRVRKLTPREYARLQGFPDSFQFVVSDTQLYKQFGNAVSVPVAKAIATNIKQYLEELN